MRPFDLAFLKAIGGRGECHVLHAHGEHLYFDRLVDYPAHALSLADLNGGPTIAEARRRTRFTLMAGLDHVKFVEKLAPGSCAGRSRGLWRRAAPPASSSRRAARCRRTRTRP